MIKVIAGGGSDDRSDSWCGYHMVLSLIFLTLKLNWGFFSGYLSANEKKRVCILIIMESFSL